MMIRDEKWGRKSKIIVRREKTERQGRRKRKKKRDFEKECNKSITLWLSGREEGTDQREEQEEGEEINSRY